MTAPPIHQESDYNAYQQARLLETLGRLSLFDDLSTCQEHTTPRFVPEYHLEAYLHTLKLAQDPVDFLVVVEGNASKNLSAILSKLAPLFGAFPTSETTMLYYASSPTTVCGKPYAFKTLRDFSDSLLLYSANPAPISQFDEVARVIAAAPRTHSTRVVLHFARNPLAFTLPGLRTLRNAYTHYFIFGTARPEKPVNNSIARLAAMMPPTFHHVCWTRSTLIPRLLADDTYFPLCEAQVDVDTLDAEHSARRRAKLEALVTLTRTQIPERVSRTGWYLTPAQSYRQDDALFKAFGVCVEFEVRTVTVTYDERVSGIGGFKVMHVGEMEGERVALKRNHVVLAHNLETYLGQLEINAVCQKLVEEFNAMNRQQLHFIPCGLFVETAERRTGRVTCDELRRVASESSVFLVEPLLEGKFEKWSLNTGKVIESVDLLNCFSHFTFLRTRKQLVVTDMQGIRVCNTFFLTDPSIHHESPSRFGFNGDNLAVVGINTFFQSHICNDLCLSFGL